MTKGLGRIYIPDEQDRQFLLGDILPEKAERDYRFWYPHGWWGDQGRTPRCVDYAWTAWSEDGPITHTPTTVHYDAAVYPDRSNVHPLLERPLYEDAQKVDTWPGEDYDGTSVRAGAKILQSRGLISEYRWAWDVDTLAQAVLTTGPVVVGTNWYIDMFQPDSKGFVYPSGGNAGGHAWLINGVNTAAKYFRAKNSWGRGWGDRGYFRISFENMTRLINEHGEVCLAIEKETN